METPLPPRPTDLVVADPDPIPTLARHFVGGQRPMAGWITSAAIVLASIGVNFAVQSGLSSVVGFLSVAAVAMVVWAVPGRRSRGAALALVLATLVATNLALRTSAWIVGPTVLASTSLLVLGAQDRLLDLNGRRVLRTISGWFLGVLDAVPFLGRPIRRWFSNSRDQRSAVGRGLALAAGVTVLLTTLLANADAVFASMFDGLGSSSIWTHISITALAMVPISGLAVMAHLDTSDDDPDLNIIKANYPVEGLMGLVSIVVVLGGWSITQLLVRLGGAERLLAAENLTRAEYARGGFFELVFVVVAVLVLLALLGRLVGEHHREVVVGLSLTIAAQTLLLIGVTFSKLAFYIDAFGLTMLRLAVAWFLGWLALALILVAFRLAQGGAASWVLTSLVVTTALATTAFGWSDPEAFVVSVNVSKARAGTQLDESFLESLGPDASPTIVRLLPDSDLAEQICSERPDDSTYGWLGWNRSRARAASLACFD